MPDRLILKADNRLKRPVREPCQRKTVTTVASEKTKKSLTGDIKI
jgi:hypothetical protein